MTEDEFWEIIAQSQPVSPGTTEETQEGQIKRLHAILLPLPVEELGDYHYHFMKSYYGLYRCDIWECASIIDDELSHSDDSFKDFRSWLISRGKDAYDSVYREPDTLEQFVTDEMQHEYNPGYYYLQWEGFASVADHVHKEKYGEYPPDDFGDIHSSQTTEDIKAIMVARDWGPPAGEWTDSDDKDALRRKYPRTVARFGHLPHNTIQPDETD